MNIVLVGIVAFLLFDGFAVWSMCVVAARADRRMDEMHARAISDAPRVDEPEDGAAAQLGEKQ